MSHPLRRLGVGFLLLSPAMAGSPPALMAQTGAVAGVVVEESGETPLAQVSVRIAGTSRATLTAEDGTFLLDDVPAGEHMLSATRFGFADASTSVLVAPGGTVEVRLGLPYLPIHLEAISVTGSRRLQKVTDAPVALSLLTSADLSATTELSYVGAVERMRGVDTYRTGIANVVPNARGFGSAFNYRFRVMVDHRNAHSPSFGIPGGFAYPLMIEDVDRMEAVLGPSSALYGPNAHNGLLHVLTKHPRDHPGTSVAVAAGTRSLRSGRIRHAEAYDRFAYKVNAEYVRGDDWVRNDTVAIDQQGRAYLENPDHSVESARGSASLYFSPTADVQVIGSGGFSRTDAVITTNTGRNQVSGAIYDYQQLRVESPRLFAQVYRTGSDNGDGHSLASKVNAMVAAADAGSPISEEEAISRVRLIETGFRMNYEVQLNDGFSLGSGEVRWIVGAQHEDVRPDSRGSLFSEGRANLDDPPTETLQVRQTGLYGQLEIDLDESWRVVAATRYDRHEFYEAQVSPRLGLVYRMPDRGTLRLTFNRAFQAPELLSTELLVAAGTVPGTAVPLVVYGNGQGFTLSDGSVIEPLVPERNTTWELGYKGTLAPWLFTDVSVYRASYRNFQSPATAITDPGSGVYPVLWGDRAVDPFPDQFVLTYRNFGQLRLVGTDVGFTAQVADGLRASVDYSHMRVSGLEVPGNDFDEDGDYDELSFNTPKNKLRAGFVADGVLASGLSLRLDARWVEAFDFVSGLYRATRAGEGTGQFQFEDGGPLGGYTTLDVGAAYALTDRTRVNLSVTNLLDEPLRQSVGAPAIRRLVVTEVHHRIR